MCREVQSISIEEVVEMNLIPRCRASENRSTGGLDSFVDQDEEKGWRGVLGEYRRTRIRSRNPEKQEHVI